MRACVNRAGKQVTAYGAFADSIIPHSEQAQYFGIHEPGGGGHDIKFGHGPSGRNGWSGAHKSHDTRVSLSRFYVFLCAIYTHMLVCARMRAGTQTHARTHAHVRTLREVHLGTCMLMLTRTQTPTHALLMHCIAFCTCLLTLRTVSSRTNALSLHELFLHLHELFLQDPLGVGAVA